MELTKLDAINTCVLVSHNSEYLNKFENVMR